MPEYYHNKGEKRSTFIAFEEGFHGDTFGAMSTSGLSVYNGPFEDVFADVKRIPVPNDENLEEVKGLLRTVISENNCAAFVFRNNSGLEDRFLPSASAIHCCIVPGNELVKRLSKNLSSHGFDAKPILSPTVPEGTERLRICIHSFNTEAEIRKLVELLATFVQ